jgi:hypothetical protein
MKFSLTFLIIAIISLSFVGKNNPTLNNNVYGIWQGVYGDSIVIEELVINLKPGNKMELTRKQKIEGTYVIKGDTAIIFSYKNQDGCSQVLMHGNLNKTMNFVDGVWEVGAEAKGNFYLQKQK